MHCETYQKYISELVDNELNDKGNASVFRHLGECPTCRLFFHSCLKLKETVGSMSYDSLPGPGQEKTGWLQRNLRIPLPAAAVFVVLFITGLFGTSLHFFQKDDPVRTGEQQIIYISEYPEIEIQLMTEWE